MRNKSEHNGRRRLGNDLNDYDDDEDIDDDDNEQDPDENSQAVVLPTPMMVVKKFQCKR